MDLDAPPIDRTAAYIEAQRMLASVSARLTSALAAACRRDWASLDPAGGGDDGGTAAVIDPEALVVASLWLEPRDAAIGPAMHAWVEAWSDLLSVQRTRNIAKAFPASVQPALRALALTAYERGKDFRWAPLVKGMVATPASTTAIDDDATGGSAEGPAAHRAARLPVHRAALLMLRLRMAFGVGARPDAVAYLLARDSSWSSITEIAHATGYTPSAIRRALDRMAEAQIVAMVDEGATRFRCEFDGWASLLALHGRVAAWQHRLQVFAFIAQFVELADSLSRRKLTAYAITEAVRDLARPVRVHADADGQRAFHAAFVNGTTLDDMERALLRLADQVQAADAG